MSAALVRPYAAAAVLAVGLTGCASDVALRVTSEKTLRADPAAAQHEILIATTREPSSDPAIAFTGERAASLSYADAIVSVPPTHKTGNIERPSRGKIDPARHFDAVSLNSLAGPRDLEARVAGKDVLLFIHGYRNNFSDALFRLTQIVHDTKFSGSAVLFSWASRGRTIDYIYDRDSATAARDALEQTLRTLAAAKPRKINILAHSMGGWVTMEALRQLKIGGDADLGGRIGDVILASPDISADVFKAQMERYGKPKRPFFLLLSRDDKALQLSQALAGNKPRLGSYVNDREIANLGVIVVDLTNVNDPNSLNHSKFADNPELVKLLGDRLREGDRMMPRPAGVGENLVNLGVGVGTVLESTARVIITTPQTVLQAAIPQ